MEPALYVFAGWLLFGGTHIVLATSPIRGPLVRRWGESGFRALFLAVASISFAALAATYSLVRFQGAPALGLGVIPWVRLALIGAMGLGLVLMTAAFAPRAYWESPTADRKHSVREPRGLERISRHPFFAGAALLMGAHVLLATRLTGVVFFGGFLAPIVAGAAHQSRKITADVGEDYVRYLAQTSAIPFVAIARGRQRFVPSELPWAFVALGALVAVGVRRVHDGILSSYGAPLIAVVVGAGLLVSWILARRSAVRVGTARSITQG